MSLDDFSKNYLRMALAIDQHFPGFVDAYYGPEEIKAEVEAQGQQAPQALLDELAELATAVPTDDPHRQTYLEAHLRAMDCVLQMVNGETFDYLDEVNRIYDIAPQKIDEETFLAAHKELDTLLPGSGNINERIAERRKRYELETAQILPLLELARNETQKRTAVYLEQQDLPSLPSGEDVELKLASDQPWGAYNWYLGNGRSLIEFNTDLPTSVLSLLDTFAHEGYPGHHTEAALKEMTLYQQKGYGEQSAMLLHSPAAVISEGIATTALEIIFPDDTHYGWIVDVLLPEAKIHVGETAVDLKRIANATKQLYYASGNAAILYHTGQLNREQTIDYLQTYTLAPRDRAEKSFQFITAPLSRNYIFTYTIGYDLIAASQEREDLFGRLLIEQMLPSQFG